MSQATIAEGKEYREPRSASPQAIERHGEVIGYYLPVRRKDPEAINKRLEAFERALERLLVETELSEEAFAQLVEQAQVQPREKADR